MPPVSFGVGFVAPGCAFLYNFARPFSMNFVELCYPASLLWSVSILFPCLLCPATRSGASSYLRAVSVVSEGSCGLLLGFVFPFSIAKCQFGGVYLCRVKGGF